MRERSPRPSKVPGDGAFRSAIVVIESTCLRGALRLHSGRDTHDARGALVSQARRARPDAAVVSIDGALDDADDEWWLELRGVEAHAADLGLALHRALGAGTSPHVRPTVSRRTARGCHFGLSPFPSGRRRTF